MIRLIRRLRGFTLIELLIVVAIIAILAAIAVPNFLEAQIRSKVSRAKADMRSLATALEAYSVDNNIYPPLWPAPVADSYVRMYCHFFWEYWLGREYMRCMFLTSPVAYMGSKVPMDPFVWREGNPDAYHRKSSFWYENFQGAYKDKDKLGGNDSSYGLYFHPSIQPLTAIRITAADGPVKTVAWTMCSAGPGGAITMGLTDMGSAYPTLSTGRILVYDPTNGTTSRGGIINSSAGFLGN